MCGIAGILSTGERIERQALVAMIGQLRHRGPDGYGLYQDERAALAHARLSIIDLEGGGQPIHNEDATVWVTFNGEIFNYVELREALMARGHRFYTQSDTEVIVHLYEDHGVDFVRHLNGQFAIGLWDTRRRRLVLARDRAGIRPLFYTQTDGAFLFGSEVKSLFAYPGVARELDVNALGQLFTYWSPLPPRTIFKGVSSLPPGHVLVREDGETPVTKRYWDWHFPVKGAHKNLGPEEAAEALRERLIEAVRLQLRADVPVGAYLSGGLDSSVIVSLIKRYTDTSLRTFSLRFEDAEFDEGEFQGALVSELDTEHTELTCTRKDIGDAFPRALWHIESPVLRTAPVPMMLLSGLVRRQGYKVVLTGEGADEVLAGYDLFKEAKIRRFWARNPTSGWRPALLRRIYPYLSHSPTALDAYSRRFFGADMEEPGGAGFAHLPRWRTTQRNWRFLSADALEQQDAIQPAQRIAHYLPPDARAWDPLHRDQYVEALTLLSGYILCSQGDRVSLANSVEGRFPFLDHHVIEFCNALPPRYKLMGLQEKWLLKEAMRGLVPVSILERKKQPYRAPDSSSFFQYGESKAYVDELFSPARLRDAGYFDVAATRKLFDKCRDGRAIGFSDNMAFVGIFSTMLIDELFVRRFAIEQREPESVVEMAAG
jgi:asparagine synthase (glutamine-hydrolysing)